MTVPKIVKRIGFEVGYVLGGIVIAPLVSIVAPFVMVVMWFKRDTAKKNPKIDFPTGKKGFFVEILLSPVVFLLGILFGIAMPFGLFRYIIKGVEKEEQERQQKTATRNKNQVNNKIDSYVKIMGSICAHVRVVRLPNNIIVIGGPRRVVEHAEEEHVSEEEQEPNGNIAHLQEAVPPATSVLVSSTGLATKPT